MLTNNKSLAILGLALLSSTATAQDLVISEVVDGTLPGGLPKWVELTNNSAGTIDISDYTIGNFNNGATTLGGGISQALIGMIPAGESYIVSYESGDAPGLGVFFDTYGCDPDNLDLNAFINGDDCVALFLADGLGPLGEANGDGSDATLHDVYGDIGVDGTGMPWETTDSYGNRIGTAASATFVLADWTFAGADALEDVDDIAELANLLAQTTPSSQAGCGGAPPVVYASSCNGDGGDQMGCTDCPCGNNAPAGTAGGCQHSASAGGGGSLLIAAGDASVSLPSGSVTDLKLSMTNMPPTSTAVMFSGSAIAPQNVANPCFGFGVAVALGTSGEKDGLRCAVGGLLRHGNRQSNASGDILDDSGPNRTWGGVAGPAVGIAAQGAFMSGQTRYFQATHRDLPGAVCMTALNTSQAIEVTFTP